MLKIGEFSRLTRVSVRMLHYYDDIGLLKPVQTDKFTGYRLYSVSQVAALHRHRRGGEVDPAPRRDPALPPHLDPGGRAGLAPRGRHQQQPQPEGGLPLAGDRGGER